MKNHKTDIKLIKGFLKYFRPYILTCIVLLILIVINLVLTLFQPKVWANLLTNLFKDGFGELKNTLVILGLLYLGITGVSYLQSLLKAHLNNKIIYDMQNHMFGRLLSMKMEYLDQNSTGAFTSKIVMDVNQIVDLTFNQIIPAIVNIIKVVFLAGIMFYLNIPLAILTIGLTPVILYIYSSRTKVVRKKQNEVRESNDNLIGVIQQATLGVKEIKLLGVKSVQEKLFISSNKDKTVKTFGFTKYLLSFQTLISCIGILGEISVFVLGSYFVICAAMTITEFIQFTSYSQQFSSSSLSLITIISDFQKIMVSLKRLAEIEDSMNAEYEFHGEVGIQDEITAIQFDNVTYGYQNKRVFEKASTDIKPNSISTIVGQSGIGKTTMLNLLSGLYSISSGTIKINGINIKDYSENALRCLIVSVSQRPYLFNSTIEDNFRYVNSMIKMEQIIEICKMCDIHTAIDKLPNGYKTIIQEQASNFSVGQMQRLGIARAIAKNTPIILFDEPTSALDKNSAEIIKMLLIKLKQTKTILVVSHSQDLIDISDQVFEISNYKINQIKKRSA